MAVVEVPEKRMDELNGFQGCLDRFDRSMVSKARKGDVDNAGTSLLVFRWLFFPLFI